MENELKNTENAHDRINSRLKPTWLAQTKRFDYTPPHCTLRLHQVLLHWVLRIPFHTYPYYTLLTVG
eukprot:5506470-Amphidinium_carterae.1